MSVLSLKDMGLVSTGLTLGLLHVLAGPDHLSALAALSVAGSWRAMWLGFRWGMGHSTGLIVVAIVFIFLKGNMDLRTLGRYCDTFVGLFMIALGCHGIVGTLRQHQGNRRKKDTDVEMSFLHESSQPELAHGFDHDVDDVDCSCIPLVDLRDPYTQRLLSFSVGLLHGVAGPGAILGVLPAVEMQNLRSSVLYLGAFVFASTTSMGAFAALYGEATKRLGATAESIELALRILSAAMSVCVGSIWLTLSVLGKLEDFFH